MNENHHRFRGCLFITLLKAHDRRVRRQTMAASFRPLVFQSCQAIAGAVKNDGVCRHTLIYGRHEDAGRKTGSHI